jgi:hypothetical protein
MALQTLPANERGVNIQIPVAMIVAVLAILIVLLTGRTRSCASGEYDSTTVLPALQDC